MAEGGKSESMRGVRRVIEPQVVRDGAGVKLRRSIASAALDYLDPFLLLDEFKSDNPDDYMAGFPMHPHRGIETVTYMLAGAVDHRDSIGNSGSIQAGDVQWMTAGRGIMHEEMPRPVDGRMAGFQLWVNLPARLKMGPPRYQEVASAQIPEVAMAKGVRIRVIAGEVSGLRGAVTEIAADPTYIDVTILPGRSFQQPIPRGHAAFAYVFEGTARFASSDPGQERTVVQPSLAILEDGDEIDVQAGEEGARFLLVSGQPLYEPIARYGPFVMNTRQEIEQALRELRDGTFIR